MSSSDNNDKIKKIAIILVPAVLLVGAYVMFFTGSPETTQTDKKDSTFSSVVVPDAANNNQNKSKIDLYNSTAQQHQEISQEQQRTSNLDDIIQSASGNNQTTKPAEDYSSAWGGNPQVAQQQPVAEPQAPVKRKTKNATSNPVVNTPTAPAPVKNGFYSSSNTSQANSSTGVNSQSQRGAQSNQEHASALIDGEYTVRSGQSVKIRMTEEYTVKGTTIPKGTVLTGVVTISEERVYITVSSVRIGNSIQGMKLEILDNDGNTGIYIPGGVNQEIAAGSVQNGVQVSTRVPIIGGTISTGTGKKVQDPSVHISTGYKVFVREIKEY